MTNVWSDNDCSWELTGLDIMAVLGDEKDISFDEAEHNAEKIFATFTKEDKARIAKAALMGNDLDEQSDYADEELRKILIEKGHLS